MCKCLGQIENRLMYLDKLDKKEEEYKQKFKISF